MKAVYLLLISLAMTVMVASCQKADTPQDRQAEIEAYADAINTNPVLLDGKKADTLINLYSSYVKDYPKDTMCEFYLFQMANVYAAMKQCDSCLHCLDRIIKEYPDGKKVGAAYFFKGVFLKDVCLNTEESVKAFETYIQKFPDSKQIETAKRMIQMDTMQNPLDMIQEDGKQQ